MFNVTRPSEEPASLARGEYNHPDVVSVLKQMFFSKCYLCERNDIQDVEIEHFEPHMGDMQLKLAWRNLFYSCSRCNSIKGHRHTNILDCTDDNVDVSGLIAFKMTTIPDDDIIVTAAEDNPSQAVVNTVELLHRCYNETNTASRSISREALVEQIFGYLEAFWEARKLLRDPSVGPTKKNDAKEVIEAMMQATHPFSAFWRWQYLGNSFLTNNYPEINPTLTSTLTPTTTD